MTKEWLNSCMKHLFTAFACEPLGGEGKVLFPGYPAKPDMPRLAPGDALEVELADGTRLQTKVVNTQVVSFTENALARFIRAEPGFYCAVHVPADFDAPGIELGAKVFLDDSTSRAEAPPKQ